jgi:hypothetical protein
MELPAMTIAFSGPDGVPTVFASKDSGGALSPNKRYVMTDREGPPQAIG